MGFTKLDECILQSSIMAESPATFKVWIAILAACDYSGIAKVSSIFLSSVCRLPLNIIDKAIERLESEDPRSRSTNDEGRRIEKCDGGWVVLNYQKYRNFSLKAQGTERKSIYRERQREMYPDGGYVYFAQAGKKIKIGFSLNPWARVHEFSTSNPNIKLLGTVHGTTGDEKVLHDRYKDHAIGGEWFKASALLPDIKRIIKDGTTDGLRMDYSASASSSVIREITTYLNEKAGKKFTPKSSDTIKHITARINEGRGIEDFKRVVDVKVAKWKGKTWNDTRSGREGQIVHGDDFLCPSTLFCAKNFETYLNESGPAQKMTPAEFKAQHEAEMKGLQERGR